MFCIKIKKLPSVTLFSKLHIKSEHINAVNRTKTYHSTLIFPSFRQYLDKKVRTSCPEMSTKQLGQLKQHRGRVNSMLSPILCSMFLRQYKHNILLSVLPTNILAAFSRVKMLPRSLKTDCNTLTLFCKHY